MILLCTNILSVTIALMQYTWIIAKIKTERLEFIQKYTFIDCLIVVFIIIKLAKTLH